MINLQELFDDLIDGKRPNIYVLMGIVDHYVLLRVSKDEVCFYDSRNTSIRDIWNGTHHQREEEGKKTEDNSNYHNRMHNLKEALEIILSLLKGEKVFSILIQKRIEDIVGSFNSIKSD